VESYKPAEKFDAIISRAFSEIGLFIKLTRHLLIENGQWLAMKGVAPHQELEGLGLKLNGIIPLTVAGLDAERHLVLIENN
jgi:16S rRNA (guanine527-N7)-methyltransferase